MHNLVDFFEIAERLECECRLTRTSDGNQQTVAAHSWNMLMMAMVLRPYLKKSVNMERVYELCVLHDLPEAITHDIPLHEQTDSVRVQKRINESDAVAQIVGLLKNNDIQARFNEYDARQSYESRLVKALDVLDTAVQHMCAQDLAYIGEYADGFYWKMFFGDEIVSMFDFEPALRGVFDEIRRRVALRLKNELGIDERDLIK